MVDDSPGKVQALRAMFSEKSNPVIGLIPSGRPWHNTETSVTEESTSKKFSEMKIGSKVLPVLEKSLSVGDKHHFRPLTKPAVGPKPSHLVQQQRMTVLSASPSNSDDSERTVCEPLSKSKAFGETIASFMFTSSNKENVCSSSNSIDCTVVPPLPPLPKPLTQLQNVNFPHKSPESNSSQCCSVISSDNYVCRVRKKELPSKETLGPAPLKPIRPSHLVLPPSCQSLLHVLAPDPVCAPRIPSLQRPSYPCPPRPVTPPPLPPTLAPIIVPSPASLWEDLYEDTLLGENKRPVSLIPEYTEEEEQAELYHDAAEIFEENSDSSLKYKKSPPPISSEYLQPNMSGSNEELYQDADRINQEEFYEVMPCDEDAAGSPLYSNNKREIEKMKKEEEKRIRREQKEKEKREKELEKLRRKFGLTGEEIPIDEGLVKWDSRGGRGDLPVKKGEIVLILRMEGNPSGRWLVKNEKGKIGYVELTNIEVDPLSVKSVMSIRRLSVVSTGEELYCEGKSEEDPH